MEPNLIPDKDETPFDKFMSQIRKEDIEIDLSKFNGIPMSKEELLGLDKIQDILKQAEKEINRIAANVSARSSKQDEPRVVTINRSDEKQYIRNLVYAKLHGLKTEYTEEQKYHSRRYKTNNKPRNKHTQSNTSCMTEDLSRELDEIIQHKIHSHLSENRQSMWVTNNHLTEIVAEDKPKSNPVLESKKLVIQNVPKINIRPRLTHQKIPSLNIFPDDDQKLENIKSDNVVLLESKHDDKPKVKFVESKIPADVECSKKEEPSPENLIPTKLDSFTSLKIDKPKVSPRKLLKEPDKFDFLCDFKHSESENSDSAATVMLNKKYSFLQKHSQYSKQSLPKKPSRNKATTSFTKAIPSKSVKSAPKIKNIDIDYIPYSKMTIGGVRTNEIINKLNITSSIPISVVTKPKNDPELSTPIETAKEESKVGEYSEDFEKSSSESKEENSVNSDNELSNSSSHRNISQISPPQTLFSENKTSSVSDDKLSMPSVSLKIKPKPILTMKSKVDVFDYVPSIDTRDNSIQTDRETPRDMKYTQTSPIVENTQVINRLSSLTLQDILELKKEIKSILSKSELPKEEENDQIVCLPESKFIQTSPIKINTIDKQLSPVFSRKAISVETMTETFSNPTRTKIPEPKNVSFDDSARYFSSDVLTDGSHSETSETKSIGEINFKLLRRQNITVKTSNKSKNNYSKSFRFDSSTNSDFHSTSMSKSDGEVNE